MIYIIENLYINLNLYLNFINYLIYSYNVTIILLI
nr:MAG TPA: hypothetical protein [Caudoviricetes sp.]